MESCAEGIRGRHPGRMRYYWWRGSLGMVRMTLGLAWAVDPFVEHYHRERNYQGLDNRIIQADFE